MARESGTFQIDENKQKQMQTEQEQIRRRVKQIKHQILVLSGKGGVGKSTVAANIAVSLALAGKKVGLLDIDIHGPSIPKILNLERKTVQAAGDTILPIEMFENLKVMSIGFLLRGTSDAVIWRGPMKYQIIKQFLKDVDWGSLDFLVVDSPPGTGDEPLSIVQLLENADGAIIVTTPQEVALSDVRKCITFCGQLNLPVLGVLENMSGFVCPKCGEKTDIFKSGGGELMASQMHVPFLGRIPIDLQIVQSCDSGRPFVYHYNQTKAANEFKKILNPILKLDSNPQELIETQSLQTGDKKMRIAVPLVQGRLSLHFGHCDQFAIFDIDGETSKVINRKDATPPAHAPGVLPKWLHENNVSIIIAGGMGQRAQQLFAQNDIKVVIGASSNSPEELVSAYLQNTLETGDNICDH
ncbi:MAG: iron-sulfur cluster carrier protein MrpORP [Sedimentisphaerales bacterium]|jgi:Mrp family chromosome partitioning ATPase/predicted Fe-Mo cluster-binding NifX family protein